MAIPTLTMIPSGYKAGTLYSVLPTNGDGDFTTTRTSSATRVNKSGLIETVLSNVPRLDYSDGSCPSLLLEPQSTNLIPYSENFNNWSDTGVTVTSNATISPSGELNADKLQSTTNNWRRRYSYNGINGNEYSVSIYAKLDNSTSTTTARIEIYRGTNSIASTFNLSTGSISGGLDNTFIENVGNGWYRIGGTYVANGTNNIFYLYPSSGYGSAGTMFFWGSQVEQQSYPTSYISTNGSAVTRNVDLAKKGGLSNSIGQVEGTVFLDFEYLLEIGTNSSNDALRDIFVVGSDLNYANIISVDNYRSQFRIFITANGVTSSIGLGVSGTSQANTRYKLAFRYKSGDSKAFLNGVQMGSSTNLVNFTNTLDSVFFSYNNSSNSFKNQKKVNGLQIFTEALTDAELQTLTTI